MLFHDNKNQCNFCHYKTTLTIGAFRTRRDKKKQEKKKTPEIDRNRHIFLEMFSMPLGITMKSLVLCSNLLRLFKLFTFSDWIKSKLLAKFPNSSLLFYFLKVISKFCMVSLNLSVNFFQASAQNWN